MKALIALTISLATTAVLAQSMTAPATTTTKTKKTTRSTEYVFPENTDSTIIHKKTKIKPGTINADGSVTPATQTTTTKKTRKY